MEAAGVALAIPAIIELCLKYSYPSFPCLVGWWGVATAGTWLLMFQKLNRNIYFEF